MHGNRSINVAGGDYCINEYDWKWGHVVLPLLIIGSLLIPAIRIEAQEVYGPPVPWKTFKNSSVFLGLAKKGEALIALYLREERWTDRGMKVEAVLVPTLKFPFESGYRGFQKKEHYRIKKGETLRLFYGGHVANFSLVRHVDIGDTTPIAVEFTSRDKGGKLVPDDITKVEFRIKHVFRWEKVPKKDLSMWSRSFDRMEVGGKRRVGLGRTGGSKPATAGEPGKVTYEGRYVTLNGTYVFEKQTVYSPIIAVLGIGTYIEHARPLGDGWTEVLYGESGRKGYVLSVYLVGSKEEALRWENEKDLVPVEPPLRPSIAEGGSSATTQEP